MKSKIKAFDSPDLRNLRELEPYNPESGVVDVTKSDFGVLIEVFVGPADDALRSFGKEMFQVMVCSPDWLARRVREGPLIGRHHLFVEKWDWVSIQETLRSLFEIEGATWPEIAQQLARIGGWEFEDYKGH
jgi:hypothetical protein